MLLIKLTCICGFSHDVALVSINFRVILDDVKTSKPEKALRERFHKMEPNTNLENFCSSLRVF